MSRSACLLVLLLLSACTGGPRPAQAPGEFTGGGSIPVFVVNHGWHTGVLLAAEPVQARMPQLQERFGHAAHLEFGWGDRAFYESTEMSVRLALRAVLWPTDTVVRVLAVRRPLDEYVVGAGAVKLCLNEAELTALLDFLAASFETENGRILPRDGNPTGPSQFYTGAGRYHMMNTCNVWTARALESVGMDISSTLKLTAGSVMGYLQDQASVAVLTEIETAQRPAAHAFNCP